MAEPRKDTRMDSMTKLDDLDMILGDVLEEVTHTVARKKARGTLHGAVLTVPNAQLSMLCFLTSEGEGEVRCNQIIDGPPELKHLESGLAMGIIRRGEPLQTVVELRMAYLDETKWARVREPSEAEFDLAVGGSVRQFLLSHGALAVGSRAQVFGDTTRRRGILCVSLPDGAPSDVFLHVYGAARLVPLMREIEAGH